MSVTFTATLSVPEETVLHLSSMLNLQQPHRSVSSALTTTPPPAGSARYAVPPIVAVRYRRRWVKGSDQLACRLSGM